MIDRDELLDLDAELCEECNEPNWACTAIHCLSMALSAIHVGDFRSARRNLRLGLWVEWPEGTEW